MTSKRRAKKKPDSPSSPTPEKTSSSSGASSSSSKSVKTSNHSKDQEKNKSTSSSKNTESLVSSLTPQHIKKEIGVMKLNGHFNDLDECFSENSILFGKEINSTRKRSIVTLIQHEDEEFKKLQLRRSNNSSLNETAIHLTGSKKRKQTRPVQAPVH